MFELATSMGWFTVDLVGSKFIVPAKMWNYLLPQYPKESGTKKQTFTVLHCSYPIRFDS